MGKWRLNFLNATPPDQPPKGKGAHGIARHDLERHGHCSDGGWRRVRPPGGRASFNPRVPSAALRAAFGRAGDEAGRPGDAHDDRPPVAAPGRDHSKS